MTKAEIVSEVESANTKIVFALLSSRFPILKTPILAFVVKYYLKKFFTPLIEQGSVFIAFKAIDWQQLEKAKHFNDAISYLAEVMEKGSSDDVVSIAADSFDSAFRDAIRLRP